MALEGKTTSMCGRGVMLFRGISLQWLGVTRLVLIFGDGPILILRYAAQWNGRPSAPKQKLRKFFLCPGGGESLVRVAQT